MLQLVKVSKVISLAFIFGKFGSDVPFCDLADTLA